MASTVVHWLGTGFIKVFGATETDTTKPYGKTLCGYAKRVVDDSDPPANPE